MMPMSFRLALINPNTNTGHTETMAASARAVLPAGAEVVEFTATRGATMIEGRAEATIGAAEVIDIVAANPGYDAYLIGCFADLGLLGARELTRAPVVGIGESALRAASLVSNRFGLVTTLPRSIGEMEDEIAAAGLAERSAGVVAIAGDGGETWDDDELIATARGLVEERGAEALVLACGAMTEVARRVSDELGVPVCDGVAFGALTAHALARMGLQTSKRRSLAFPEPVAYRGMEPLVGAP